MDKKMREIHPNFEGRYHYHQDEDADFGNGPCRRQFCQVEGIWVNDGWYYMNDDSSPDYCYDNIFYFLDGEIRRDDIEEELWDFETKWFTVEIIVVFSSLALFFRSRSTSLSLV